MAASGFTPISLYYSTTASAVPSAGNLVAGELALNTTDEKLYFKNAAGTVKLLASNATSAPVLSFSAGTTGFTPSTATTGAITLAGTLNVANGGTGVTTSTGTGSVVLSTSPTLVTPALGTPSSGVVTNLTGTASININGTVGATTPTTGAFTTLTASGQINGRSSNGNVFVTSNGSDADFVLSLASGLVTQNVTGSLQLQTGGVNRAVISSTGLAVTGSLSTTGGATFNGSVNASSGTGNTTITATNTTSALQLQSNSQDGYLNMTGTGYIYLRFGAGSNLKFTFGPSGQFGVNGSSYGTAGQVLTSGGSGAAPTWTTAASGAQAFVAFGSTGGY